MSDSYGGDVGQPQDPYRSPDPSTPAWGAPDTAPPPYVGPPAPYAGPPPFSRPGYSEPQYGAPPFGPPAYAPPGYATPGWAGGPSGPPTSGGGSRAAIIVVVAVLVLFVGGIGVAAALGAFHGHPGTDQAASTSTSAASDFGTGAPTAGTSGGGPGSGGSAGGGSSSGAGGTPPTEAQARAVVVAYFADVNRQDKTDALDLACADKRDAFQEFIDSDDSDFRYVITASQFTDSTVSGGTRSVVFDTQVTEAGAPSSIEYTFDTVAEGGDARLCGESTD